MSSGSAPHGLRSLLATSGVVVMPGGATPLEARCARAAGFEAFFLSGYAVAAWRHGLPDLGLIGLAEVEQATAAVTAAATPLAVLVDADTGYGGPANVARTISTLERAGAAGVVLEDQEWPKRCGHLAGKRVVAVDEMLGRLDAALRARRDSQTVIVARTDALGPLGLEEAIARGRRYADAGADAVFVDAPESLEHVHAIGSAIPGPLVINMSESGRTPIVAADELGRLGFTVILYPTGALRLAAAHIQRYYAALRQDGSSREVSAGMATLDEFNALLDMGAVLRWDRGPR